MVDDLVRSCRHVLLHVTHRCHCSCRHCFETTHTHPTAVEMDRRQIAAVLDQLMTSGCLFLTLTGGEPFLRQDLLQIVGDARQRRFGVVLKTTGHQLGRVEANALKELGVLEVQLSVYSHRADVADSFTRVAGSWQRTMEAFKLLHEVGVRTRLVAAMTAFNRSELVELAALATELGARHSIDPSVCIRRNGDRSPLELAVSAADRARAIESLDMVPGWIYPHASSICTGTSRRPNKNHHVCGAARNLVSISATGEVHPCMLFPQSAGNALKEGFWKVWSESPLMREVRSLTLKELAEGGCKGCRHVEYCNPCPANAFVETGNMRGCNSSSRANAEAVLLLAQSHLERTNPSGTAP